MIDKRRIRDVGDAREVLQTRLAYTFQDVELLSNALTHTSARSKSGRGRFGYERLEFLGDRVFGLIIADMLMQRYPNEPEGALAKRHTALVQQAALVSVAQQIGLGEAIAMAGSEEESGGREKPAILADACEALIGALYRDGGLKAAKDFIVTYWEPLIEGYKAPPQDPKTALQEWVQSRGLPLPEYRLLCQEGPDHAPRFTVQVSVANYPPLSGFGGSKREAEKNAAAVFYAYLDESGEI